MLAREGVGERESTRRWLCMHKSIWACWTAVCRAQSALTMTPKNTFFSIYILARISFPIFLFFCCFWKLFVRLNIKMKDFTVNNAKANYDLIKVFMGEFIKIIYDTPKSKTKKTKRNAINITPHCCPFALHCWGFSHICDQVWRHVHGPLLAIYGTLSTFWMRFPFIEYWKYFTGKSLFWYLDKHMATDRHLHTYPFIL